MRHFSFIILLLIVIINSQAQIKLDTTDYAILQYDKNNPWAFDKNCKASSLTENEIADVENILYRCVNKYNTSQTKYFNQLNKKEPQHHFELKNFIVDLTNYKRQFIAVINSKGEKEVWVNCFRPFKNFNYNYWRQTIVFVNDGGNNFFNLKVNLATKSYHDFSVNGEA